MGSSFFKTALSPAGAIFGNNSFLSKLGASATEGPAAFAGPNSFIAKESHYDPLMSSTVGKYVNPAAYQAGQAYGARRAPPPGYNGGAGPYSGQNPSLGAAATGYGS